MRKRIDVHTHVLPEKLPRFKDKFGYGGFIELDHHKPCCARMMRDDGKFFREIEDNCWSDSRRLEDCERDGVSVQVISTVPVMFSYWAKPRDTNEVARFLNDNIAQTVARSPTRFVGLGTLPLQNPALAVAELERCVKELGLAGVQIGTHVNDWNLDAPELRPVFECAEKLGASVFVHPWDMLGESRMPRYWLPWLVGMPAELSLAICSMIFGGVFERFPKLRVLFAHGGGAFPGTLGRIQHGFEARPDLCAVDNPLSPWDSRRKFFVDSLVHDPDTLQSIVRLFGADRVSLGTDYPFPLGEARPGRMIEECGHFDAATQDQLLWGTALEWLGSRVREQLKWRAS